MGVIHRKNKDQNIMSAEFLTSSEQRANKYSIGISSDLGHSDTGAQTPQVMLETHGTQKVKRAPN